jgi:hypothetical protein
MKIGIYGTGKVGSALARKWAPKGHELKITNAGDTPKLEGLLRETGPVATAGTAAEVARFGEVLLLAVPWRNAYPLLESAGDLTGKIVIDCTNPVKPDLSGLEIGHTTSAAEEIARRFPDARVVKAYSTVPASLLGDPRGNQAAPPFLLYCGDDALAKKVVARLIEDSGFTPLDVGPLRMARSLEPLAMLYLGLAQTGFNKPGFLTLVQY